MFKSFSNFLILNEGVSKQLASVQLSKKWASEISPQEIQLRLNNQSKNLEANLDSIVNKISSADPTPNKEYFGWILTQFVNDKIRLPEDDHIIQQDLKFYSTIKKNSVLKRLAPKIIEKLKLNSKQNVLDLMTLDRKTLQEVIDSVKELTNGDLDSNRKKAEIAKHEGAESLYEDSAIQLIEVNEAPAAVFYAKGQELKDNLLRVILVRR